MSVTLSHTRQYTGDDAFAVSDRVSVGQHDPVNPLALYKRADEHRERGRLDLWRQSVDIALALDHETPEQIYYRARAKLMLGDWSGWADYEVRTSGAAFKVHRTELARTLRWGHVAWDGTEDLQEKTLLVIGEQGFGDTIQMLRFVRELSLRARHIVLVVPAPLVSLVRHNYGDVATIIASCSGLSVTFDRYVWLMSLPFVFGRLPIFVALTAPGPIRHLRVEQRPLRVGLCWAGNSTYTRDHQRSLPIATFARLLARDDCQWYSLQIGHRAMDAEPYSRVVKPMPPLVTFADTANLIAALDCVVSVDTAVCHLAASLGVPTFLLLNTAAVWRWGLDDSTPWYPSMCLIRQSRPDDWQTALSQVCSHLDGLRSRKTHASASGNVIGALCR